MERKQTAIILITRVSRWAAVLAIVLSVLSTQQSWAAFACHCESHSKLTAESNHVGHDGEDSKEAQSDCHHNACEGEAPEGSHDSDRAEDSSSAESPAVPDSPTASENWGSRAVSCCCLIQASPPDVSTLSLLTQQPAPIEDAPVSLVPVVSLSAVMISIHGPPRSASSRPVYLVQSSLLI